MPYLVRFRSILAHSWWGKVLADMDIEPTELAGGLLKVVVGLQLLSPVSTFSVSPAFADLAILPEWAWGGFLVLVGTGHLVALRDGNRSWRRWAALLGFLVWFAFGVTFLHSAPASIGGGVFLTFAAGQLWVYTRLGKLAVQP